MAVDEQVGDAVFAVAAQMNAVAEAHRAAAVGVLARWGVGEAVAGLLWLLASSREPLTMRQLAEQLHCDPSNVTLLAERLENAGLGRRVFDPDDRRRRIVHLTARGSDAWHDVRAVVLTASPLACLNPADLNTLADRLRIALTTPRGETP